MQKFRLSLASLMLMAGTLAFVATAVVEYLSSGELVARSDARTQALKGQILIAREAMLLTDLEAAQRGFIITGEAAFLEPYERARLDLAAAHQALRTHLTADLTADSGVMPDALHRLERLSEQRAADLAANIAQRWARGESVLKDLQGYVAGKRLMDEIRGELAQLDAAQAQQVLRAEQGMQAVRERTLVLAGVMPAVGCALIVGAVLALSSERRGRDRAEQALQQANATLEEQVNRRTAELSDALTRIRSFATEQDAHIEAERRRLAREVHDRMGQVGTATKMLVLGLRRTLPPGHEESLTELIALADEGIATARNISAALRPPLLDDFGLAAAVDHYAKGLARQGPLQVRVDMKDGEELNATQANQLFRILQEATTNVLRHAQAQGLELLGRQVDDRYLLEIIDNGRGPGDVRVDASGLRNMRERAELAGGQLEFGPGPLRGTRVAVSLPLDGFSEDLPAHSEET